MPLPAANGRRGTVLLPVASSHVESNESQSLTQPMLVSNQSPKLSQKALLRANFRKPTEDHLCSPPYNSWQTPRDDDTVASYPAATSSCISNQLLHQRTRTCITKHRTPASPSSRHQHCQAADTCNTEQQTAASLNSRPDHAITPCSRMTTLLELSSALRGHIDIPPI